LDIVWLAIMGDPVDYKLIEVQTEGDVAVLRLNQPNKLNALSPSMVEELSAALGTLPASARAVILAGNGRAFCSGAALDEPGAPSAIARDPGAFLESHINPLMTQLRELPVPWISVVRGAAAGVGASLALSADMVIASDNAYFLLAFARIGLVPDGGVTHLLVRTLGRVRAMELMLLAERLPAAKACEWGLINRVTADADLESESLQLARLLAAGPSLTFGLIRSAAWSAADSAWAEVLRDERQNQKVAGHTEDAGEGINAFLEKRAAQFVGR
jgi:2-(1,2-epoxy-1,2-dihydrophenyl)acetyl-CoA isomerase